MAIYNFQTQEFGISEAGLHLLRSGFNYRTITFSEIARIRIERGKELHNWWMIFVLGAVLIGLGIYLSLGAIKTLIEGDIAPRHAKLLLLLLIPMVGGYFVYNSFQTGLVLKIYCCSGEKDMFPLRSIVKEGKLQEFKSYLRDKINTKVQATAFERENH